MVNTTTRWTFGVLQRERTEQKAKFSEYSIKRKAELSTGSRKRSAWEKHTGTVLLNPIQTNGVADRVLVS